jgi:uncharacterized protein YndB with AHSA1/START domain/DNA-binding transcriptional ArsR family regulator
MGTMDTQRALATLAEPTRFRIVELLAAAPRTVGEVAEAVGARQPQTTKHLQALAAADLITVHRLGRRRVASLRRDTLRTLVDRLGELAMAHPSESVLDQYREAIEAEETRVAAGAPGDRTIRLERDLPGPPSRAWRAWTIPELVRRWWAPEHFEVADCDLDPQPGGTLRLVLREGDGAEYTAIGTFLDLRPPRELRFQMSPLGPDGAALFTSAFTVSLAGGAAHTVLTVTIDVTAVRPEAAAALAGVELGWRQSLDRLAAVLPSHP